jgi:exonuclease SbcC
MIPQRLVLKNFLCYRQADLDFAGIHLACLAGANGAGKSALLDGMTWALWGRARAKRDDELIYLGEKEMAVDFSFQLGSRAYRVLRRRKAGKRGSTLLDLQTRDDGDWQSIGESGVRRTQQRIEEILRLDYDTFANSAFLRQGRADEFTIKTPAERKRVLGDILGLDRWERYEEQAKVLLRAAVDQANLIDLRLQEIEQELAQRPEHEERAAAARQAADERSAALEEARVAYQRVEQAGAELLSVESQTAELSARLAQTERELSAAAKEEETVSKRLAERKGLVSSAQEIESGYAAYQQAVEREQELGAKLSRWTELQSRRTQLESQAEKARIELQAERDSAARRVAELQERQADESLLKEHEAAAAMLAELDDVGRRQETDRSALARAAEQRAELRARNEALRTDMDTLRERIEALDKAAAECPLCGQPLTDEHRVEMLERLRREGTARGDAFRSNRSALDELHKECSTLEKSIAEGEKLLRGREPLRRQEAALAERLERGKEASALLTEAQAALASAETALAGNNHARNLGAELDQVVQEQANLGYDFESHELARREMTSQQPYAEQQARLAAALAEIEQDEEGLHRIHERESQLRERCRADSARLADLQNQAKSLQEQIKERAQLEQKLQQARIEEASARQQLGAAQQRLEACKRLQSQQKEKVKTRDELSRMQAVYEQLKTAFGVRGVPAMVIEAAVPEIEEETNRLLDRMTSGSMRVRFETQRETQAGEARETLQIYISDEQGARPYENYSGGEQFRVNFAIRIALSRLLARRAGARLQTLVIDEGFGTQDEVGRQRLVEAINAIKDDFARVLVVTHIEELKDLFPARIEVTRTPQGSLVEVR